MLVMNCEMNHLTENESLSYINQSFGKNISRRTYYYYKRAIFHNYEKSILEEYNNSRSEKVILHDLSKTSKGIVSMIMLKEKVSLIRKGFKLGFNLTKYDRVVIPHTHHFTDSDSQINLLLGRSKRLITEARSMR